MTSALSSRLKGFVVFLLFLGSSVLAQDGKSLAEQMLQAATAKDEAHVKQLSEQIEALPKPVHGDRKSARTLNDEALQAFSENNFGTAATAFGRALQLDPADVEIANNYGFALLKAKQYSQAKDALLAAIAMAPKRSPAWLNLATGFGEQGDLARSNAAFELALLFSQNRDKTLEFLDRIATDPVSAQTLASAAKSVHLRATTPQQPAGTALAVATAPVPLGNATADSAAPAPPASTPASDAGVASAPLGAASKASSNPSTPTDAAIEPTTQSAQAASPPPQPANASGMSMGRFNSDNMMILMILAAWLGAIAGIAIWLRRRGRSRSVAWVGGSLAMTAAFAIFVSVLMPHRGVPAQEATKANGRGIATSIASARPQESASSSASAPSPVALPKPKRMSLPDCVPTDEQIDRDSGKCFSFVPKDGQLEARPLLVKVGDAQVVDFDITSKIRTAIRQVKVECADPDNSSSTEIYEVEFGIGGRSLADYYALSSSKNDSYIRGSTRADGRVLAKSAPVIGSGRAKCTVVEAIAASKDEIADLRTDMNERSARDRASKVESDQRASQSAQDMKTFLENGAASFSDLHNSICNTPLPTQISRCVLKNRHRSDAAGWCAAVLTQAKREEGCR